MLHPYVAAALLSAAYTFDDSAVFGAVAGLPGVSARGKSIESCRIQLRVAIEAHIAEAQQLGRELPLLYGVEPPLVPLRRAPERLAAI